MNQIYTFDSNIVSDLHKDAYGFRPKSLFWDEWNDASDDQKQRIWDGLIDDLNQSNIEEGLREDAAIAATEKRIQEILDTVVGSTRADAIRYLDEAYDTGGDINFLEFHLGVPYGYLCGRIMGELLKPMVV
jgi:hypothetical protein